MFCPQCGQTYQADWIVCPTDKMDLLETPLIGKYKIQGVVGVGGMGAVYKAVNPDTGADVAVKVMKANMSGAEQLRARFQREAEAAGKLKTIHVVQVFDFGTEADGNMYLVMELLDGHPLRDEVLSPPSPMHLARVQMAMNGALKGLAAAHRAQIIHRDLKPDNIFMANSDDLEVPKILDFGIARVRSSKGAELLTQAGAMMGTASYMAPEQVRGDPDAMGPWTDIYAMGAILYELLTGTPAFSGSTLTEVLQRVGQSSYVSLKATRPGLPSKIYDLVERCLSPDIRQRPQDAEAMRAELLAAQLVEPNAPIPPPRKRGRLYSENIPSTAAASGPSLPPIQHDPPQKMTAPNVHASMLKFIGDMRTVNRLLDYFETTRVEQGAELFRTGDESNAIFLVETGELQAELETTTGKPRVLRAMGPGSVIGETGIYRAAKRSATVRATQPSTLLQLSGTALKNMQKDAPELMATFHQFVAAAIADRMVSQETQEPINPPKRKWPVVAGAVAVLAIGGVVFAMSRGGGETRQVTIADAAVTKPPPPPADAAVARARADAAPAFPEMVRIPAGDHQIGMVGKGLLPPTRVTVSEFWIDKQEMTRRELEAALGDKLTATTRSKLQKDALATPARWVTWTDAAAACAARGKRLPTEAEWEVAARTTPQDPKRARLNRTGKGRPGDNEPDLAMASTDCSDAGSCDFLGGLSEWTADDHGKPGAKVVRGASYRDFVGSKLDTIHQRLAVPIGDSDNTIGFRCAHSAKGPR